MSWSMTFAGSCIFSLNAMVRIRERICVTGGLIYGQRQVEALEEYTLRKRQGKCCGLEWFELLRSPVICNAYDWNLLVVNIKPLR